MTTTGVFPQPIQSGCFQLCQLKSKPDRLKPVLLHLVIRVAAVGLFCVAGQGSPGFLADCDGIFCSRILLGDDRLECFGRLNGLLRLQLRMCCLNRLSGAAHGPITSSLYTSANEEIPLEFLMMKQRQGLRANGCRRRGRHRLRPPAS